MRRRKLRLQSDASGAAAVEFGLIAPFMLLGLLGVFDLGYNMYAATLMRGAIYKAARDSTIEGAGNQWTSLDQRVSDVVHVIAPGAVLKYTRKSYRSYYEVGQSEDFTDINGNSICDNREPFEDANGNGSWDEDRQRQAGNGRRARCRALPSRCDLSPRLSALQADRGLRHPTAASQDDPAQSALW
jgi:Flp pilus assembly pilin Flp